MGFGKGLHRSRLDHEGKGGLFLGVIAMVRQGANALLIVAEKFDRAQTLDELASIFKDIVSSLGGFYFATGLFTPHIESNKNILAIDYPPDWVSYYFESGYIDIDPTIHLAAGSLRPLEWNTVRNISKRQRRIFDEVQDFGVKSGLTIPVHLPDKSTFIASFASLEEYRTDFRHFLMFATNALCERYITLSNFERRITINLSPREKECLTWVASGKSSWDIGVILNISENTVNFHLKNAFYKLGGKGRILCVVKAIMLGLISP